MTLTLKGMFAKKWKEYTLPDDSNLGLLNPGNPPELL